MVGRAFPVAVAAALAACGAVATTSNDSAESAPQKSATAKPQPPASSPPRQGGMTGDPWSGQYRGPGEMKITPAEPGRYSVYIDSAGPGCGGEIEGPATASSNRLTLSVKPPQPGYQECRIDFDRRGTTLQASTSGDCYLFHGAQCGAFGGEYRRTQPASAPAPSVARPSRPWIVGAWVSRGFACGGDGVIYEADGTYSTDIQSGRWQLTGNTLTETALQTSELGEDETPVANPRPVRSQILSIAPNRNAFTMRTEDGETWHMVRCR